MIPDNACTLRITAAAGTELAGASFGESQGRTLLRLYSYRLTGLYDPKAFFTHAALLGQGFPHLPKIPYCCLP